MTSRRLPTVLAAEVAMTSRRLPTVLAAEVAMTSLYAAKACILSSCFQQPTVLSGGISQKRFFEQICWRYFIYSSTTHGQVVCVDIIVD